MAEDRKMTCQTFLESQDFFTQKLTIWRFFGSFVGNFAYFQLETMIENAIYYNVKFRRKCYWELEATRDDRL